jgi:undecaprenyl-diphosphatase
MRARPERLTLIPLIVGVTFIVALASAVASGISDPFDSAVIDVIRSDALAAALSPLRQATELGSTLAVTTVAILTLVAGFVLRRPRLGITAAATIALASIGNALLKIGFARDRPELLDPLIVERGFSFPSGHSTLSMVAYGVVGVLIWRSPLPAWARRAAVTVLIVVILAVGVSRVWLGVHYPTDVLAGWTLGGLVVLLFARVSRAATGPAEATAGAGPGEPRSDQPGPG